MRNTLSKMKPEALHGQLKALINSVPSLHYEDMHYEARLASDFQIWINRALVLVSETLGSGGEAEFKLAQQKLGHTNGHEVGVEAIISLIYRALAVLEFELPASAQGAFIPAGNEFDAMAAAGKIFVSAIKNAMIVDPYLDGQFLIDFAHLLNAGVSLQLLSDAATAKPSLAPAIAKWQAQHGSTRPLTCKLAPPRSLHDRLIIVDDKDVWTVGQSFNALARRAPTSFTKTDADTAVLKLAAYGDIWANATLIGSGGLP